ncbi:MAG TPA: nucleotide exchange factor GrpE [Candidatus Acidoferrales bacterium]|jgi:molecular chaperone GrpE|nr:nucleotide exchange factor GrpE [Candidatus Acidoferrales bacterium]
MTSHYQRHPAARRPHPAGDREPEQPAAETETPPPSAEEDDLRRALAEAEDRYLRLAADFENFKRRKGQELVDSSRYASEDAVKGMLPVLDNLRRAVEHAPEGGAEEFFVNGLELVVREFETALERLGVTRIPAVGEPFDPAVHNAIGGEESADVDRDIVSQELVPGYRLHDRLIRPAMVRVAHPRGTPPAG